MSIDKEEFILRALSFCVILLAIVLFVLSQFGLINIGFFEQMKVQINK